jgi:cell division protein FtsQ
MTMTAGMAAMAPPGAGGRILDFRRRGTPPRRRRPSLLAALLRPLLAAVALVALPAGLVAWVLTAPLFRLRQVEVGGPARRVPGGWVRQALAPLAGENLVRLSLAETAGRIHRNPWIESVEIVKELPDRLRVKVAERRPVALLRIGGELVYADSEGRAIAPVATPAELEEAREAGLLVVSFAHRPHPDGMAAALKVAAELGRVQPTWAAKLARIEVLGEEDFRLETEALPFPLLVTSGAVGPKVQRLIELLPELSRRYPRIEAVDLRFSRRIVVQPASSSPLPGGRGA